MIFHIFRYFFIASLSMLFFSQVAFAEATVQDKIESLEPFIGSYPPSFSSEEEFNQIQQKYLEIKSSLDKILSDKPSDKEALYLRGWLYSLGHNMNDPVAWQGAKDDLELLIKTDESHIPARIKLAMHLVNSYQKFAPQAEILFQDAQCLSGAKPIEEVQIGMFFAFYYQGKMQKAYSQITYLNGKWPENEQYKILKETVVSVLERTSTAIKNSEQSSLIGCTNN